MRDQDDDEIITGIYRQQPESATEMINALLEDGEPQEILVFLRHLAKVHGGIPAVAEAAGLNPTQLYPTLSAEGNPSLSTLVALLKAMHLRLAVRAA